jgi:hypothetical protein
MEAKAPQIHRIDDPGAQQLALLAVPTDHELKSSNAHARFRLSKSTRERGLRHVAEIRQQLAEAKATRENTSNVHPLPRRQRRAA